jgi:hypothetical protein
MLWYGCHCSWFLGLKNLLFGLVCIYKCASQCPIIK